MNWGFLNLSIRTILVAVACIGIGPKANSATFDFDIHLGFSFLDFPSDFDPFDHRASFSRAEQRWESLITGYQDTYPRRGLGIHVAVGPFDGPGGRLGVGIPTRVDVSPEGNFAYVSSADILLDIDDVATLTSSGLFEDAIAHSIGLAIGFGTRWGDRHINGPNQYTGAAALNNYRRDYDPAAMFVPVESSLYWSEESLGNDLMTSVIDGPTTISSVTRGALIDLGYSVVPEPNHAAVPLVSLSAWLVIAESRYRRRSLRL